MHDFFFTDHDLEQLKRANITPEEAERQIGLFRNPPGFTDLDRACTPGDGVVVLTESETESALAVCENARRANRFTKFVPASGAATRMFRDLQLFNSARQDFSRGEVELNAGEGDASFAELLRFLKGIDRFAFSGSLRQAAGGDFDTLVKDFRYRPVLNALLSTDKLGYGNLPKGLIPFHRYGDETRTAFEEHLVEAALYARNADDSCRLHFTISPEHENAFRKTLERSQARFEEEFDVRYQVGFSAQKPSTDTLAVDMENRVFRLEDETILFRPGGHGALIENLNDLQGDIVYIKNIDNVAPGQLREEILRFKRILAGHLVLLQESVFEILTLLDHGKTSNSQIEKSISIARTLLSEEPPENASTEETVEFLKERLDRPIRVCGMVKNQGDPGGGPFWVRGKDGAVTRQLVETAQIDTGSVDQSAILDAATHFSPVDIVCGLRDRHGRPFDLKRFVDPDAVFISHKSKDGRDLKALERPGLWNGAMAHWITVFMEIPSESFTPVKCVTDLLKPEHLPCR